MFKKINNPILFQGNLKKKYYFEGWYYKIVSPNQDYSLAFIPGISINKFDSHCFIQVFITNRKNEIQTKYLRFPKEQFIVSNNPFNLSIGDNYFSENQIRIDINTEDVSITGNLDFIDMVPIKKTWHSPSIMGFFSYLTFMECYHGVISMNHNIQGSLKVNGNNIDFTNGKGYIEKDWGKSFPKEYVWMQSNHFANDQTSFMFSEAIIPFLGLSFHGLIINLVYDNKEYRFATYNNARVIKKRIQNNEVYYEVKKGKLLLVVKAENDVTTLLASPRNGAMIESIKEGLSGTIYLELYKNKELIYSDTGYHSGLEIMMK